jgi:hypothetical protein
MGQAEYSEFHTSENYKNVYVTPLNLFPIGKARLST